jgi:hypothetical protein
MIRIVWKVLLVTSVVMWLSPEICAAKSKKWRFELTPYAWLAGLSGDVAVQGQQESIDFSVDDMWDFRTWGMTIHSEAKRAPWSLIFDFKYTRREQEEDATRLEITTWLVEAGAAYTVIERFEVLGGIRYFDVNADIKENQIPTAEGNESWIDPIVGGRYTWPFARDWSFLARGDVGGFGVGSDFTWNVVAGVDYRVGDVSFFFGYRAFGVDYSSGTGDDLFKYDVIRNGPGIGMTFRF